jgi:hypothetical protein
MAPDVAAPLFEFVRDACRRELEKALALLSDADGDRDAAVHESRKSVRRVRAWLRLGDRYRRRALAQIDAQLRLLRRTLGPLRDGASRVEALDRLRKRRDLVRMRGALNFVRARLVEDRERRWSRRPRHGRAWSRLLQGLAELLASIDQWPLQGLNEPEARRALRRQFRRACTGRRRCVGRTGAVQRHAWRGRVRILLLQSQLLEQAGLLAPAPALKRLAQSLGNENDLALVSRVLGPLGLPERTRQTLRALVQKQRRELARRNDRRAALLLRPQLAPELYAADGDPVVAAPASTRG